jgi:hypothetical protein
MKKYVTITSKKPDEKIGKVFNLRPYDTAKEAHNACKSPDCNVFEVTVEDVDKTGKGKCTVIKKLAKKVVKENKAVSGLAILVENELEKAQVVIAAKGILDKLQKMAESLSKVEADDIMPMLDSMRLTFGPQITDRFNEVATAKIRATMDVVQEAKQAITTEVGRLESSVNGEPTDDLSMGMEPEEDLPDMGDGDMDDDSMGMSDMGMGDQPNDMDTGNDMAADLDAAFDSPAADSTSAGRARKESVQMANIKALKESRNPDRLIFETFRRTLKESKKVVESAKAVARAFAIDYSDVVGIIREFKENNAISKDTSFTIKPCDDEEGVFCVIGNNSKYCYIRGSKKACAAKVAELKTRKSSLSEGNTWKDNEKRGNGYTKKPWEKDRKEKKKSKDRDILDESVNELNREQKEFLVKVCRHARVPNVDINSLNYIPIKTLKAALERSRELTQPGVVDEILDIIDGEIAEGKTWKDDANRGNTQKKKGYFQAKGREEKNRRREETDEALTDPIKQRLASKEKSADARRAKGFSAMADAKKKVSESNRLVHLDVARGGTCRTECGAKASQDDGTASTEINDITCKKCLSGHDLYMKDNYYNNETE